MVRLQFHDAVQDLDGDLIHDEGWTIWASPATDGRPRSRGVQIVEADDFDDVVDTAELWAAVVARELTARGTVTMARERARNEWGPTKESTGRPLELTRLAGFIEDELPHLVEEALRDGGVQHEDAVERGVAAVRDRTRDLASAAKDADTRDYPRLIAERVRQGLEDKVIDRVLDVVIRVVVEATKSYFKLL